ncbi:MAG: hypothetical protein ACPGJS_13950 [Flammeovirgaceae bacterium]
MKQQHLNRLMKPYQEIDRKWLIHKPWLWETKLNLAISLGIGLSVLAMVFSGFYSDTLMVDAYSLDISPSFLGYLFISLCVIGFGFWFYKTAQFNGNIENINLDRSTLRMQFVAFYVSVLSFAMPVFIVVGIDCLKYQSMLFRSSEKSFSAVFIELFVIKCVLLVLTILIAKWKNIGGKRMVTFVIMGALFFVGGAVAVQIDAVWGPLVILGVFSFYVYKNRSSFPPFEFFLSALGFMWAPVICWGTAGVAMLPLFALLDSPAIALWLVWFLGSAGFIRYMYANQQYYYLHHYQVPKEK